MSGCYGHGEAIGHAGELLQGVTLHGEDFLITVPCPEFRSAVTAEPASEWSIVPAWKSKALRAAQEAALEQQIDRCFRLRVDSAIPVGRGCGSSTADCVAAIRAVHPSAAPDTIARLAHRAEQATDSTMFGLQPLAFLPRHGRVLRVFQGAWPAIHVTVVDLGGDSVDTLQCVRPRYSPHERAEFEELLRIAARAFEEEDAPLLGRVANAGAAIHQRHRPHAAWPALQAAASTLGAYGIATAHSGTVAAVLGPGPLPQLPGVVACYELAGEERAYAHLAHRRR